MAGAADPKSVKVNVTTGAGMDIEWTDGHSSHYSFPLLRDACPCALCDDERSKTGRQPGEPPRTKPGELPMFKPAAKPVSTEGVGKYAIRFKWNDGHELGIYSWQFLRDVCRPGLTSRSGFLHAAAAAKRHKNAAQGASPG